MHADVMATSLKWRCVAGLFSFIAAAACSHTADVVRHGADTYSVSATAASTNEKRAGARGAALSAARRHCAALGRELLVTNVKMETRGVTAGDDVEVTFRCLDKNDSRLHKPAVLPPKW